jgi:hypothetical protein
MVCKNSGKSEKKSNRVEPQRSVNEAAQVLAESKL